MDSLFPGLPKKLAELSDDELSALLAEHTVAAEKIDTDDSEFLEGLSADEIIEQYRSGAEQIKTLRAEQTARVEAHEAFVTAKAEIDADLNPVVKAEAEGDEEPEPADDEEAEVVAEAEAITEAEAEPVEKRELVLASAETVEEIVEPEPEKPRLRRPPAPAPERVVVSSPVEGAPLTAAGGLVRHVEGALTPLQLAEAMIGEAGRYGKPTKSASGSEQKILVASAKFEFPEERKLEKGDLDGNMEKIRNVVVESLPGIGGRHSLTASGGLCAPLEPIYSMPNFATDAEPFWDALPVFQAARGGVNVPAATTIGDISSAISSISEANDALGGTFATKSCQDMDCPDYTEVAVQILAHCREYGNLNARAWPEKIAHENALTMAALSRTTETFMLDRVKALSINVTQAEILGAYADLVHALTKAAAGIRYRLRMPKGSRFNVVIAEWVADLLAADQAMTQFDRYQAQAAMVGHLESLGFRVVLYKDDVTGGTSQGFADEASGALDDYPDDVQYAIYPEGQFIGIDMGVLELGIVRDSTLNSTNDFQIFGERFRNLAMLGPAQGALWVTQGVCPSGEVAAPGTALSC